ncbi:hypothetical protein ACFSC4_06705 [Deinococcus malanensis]
MGALKSANSLRGTTIHAGQRLRVPKGAVLLWSCAAPRPRSASSTRSSAWGCATRPTAWHANTTPHPTPCAA